MWGMVDYWATTLLVNLLSPEISSAHFWFVGELDVIGKLLLLVCPCVCGRGRKGCRGIPGRDGVTKAGHGLLSPGRTTLPEPLL